MKKLLLVLLSVLLLCSCQEEIKLPSLRISDGRTSFFQWDLNQKLIVENADGCNRVHFTNSSRDMALVAEVKTDENGVKYVNVPNSLLTVPLSIEAYLYKAESNSQLTVCKQVFGVVKRDKPENYVYTEDEHKDFDQLLSEMEANLEQTKQYRDEAMSTEIGTVREDLNELKDDLAYQEDLTKRVKNFIPIKSKLCDVDKSTWLSGYVNLQGNIVTDANWKRTDYIDVTFIQGYDVIFRLCSYNLIYSCAFFDKNKDFISGSSADNKRTTLVIPNNARYVIFSSANDASFSNYDIYAKVPKLITNLKNRVIVAIGDSYGIQNSDSDITKFYWEYIRDGLGLTEGTDFFHKYRIGAGFGNGGYLEQIQLLNDSVTDKEGVTDILVCGGWNDSDTSQSYGTDEAFNNGILAFDNYVRENYPNAKVTMAHISWGLYSDNAFYVKMNRSLNRYIKACNTYGWRYITNSEYILRNRGSIWQTDGAHPNNEGQKILGENLVSPLLSGSVNTNSIIGNTVVIGDKKISLNSDGTITWTSIE